jgi:ParB-like chromosome segregation protein Spo0J
MKITIHDINRAGLSNDAIIRHQNTPKVKEIVHKLESGWILPPIKVYEPRNGKYTIADGIHRLCGYLYLGILEFEAVNH